MVRRCTTWQGAAAAAALAFGVRAQEPVPTPPQEPPKENVPPPAPEPIDPAKAAAEILRKRLGLKPGPGGPPPAGPPEATEPPPAPVEGQPDTPIEVPTTQDPPPQKPQEQGGEPQPTPQDPTEAARRALQKLLPGAKPPEVAPIQDERGTPESIPVPPPQARAPAPFAQPHAEGTRWSGSLATRYRARHGAGSDDQDLVARLRLDVGDEAHDTVTAHVSVQAFGDLDGRHRDDQFSGLEHSFGDDLHARLYAAHVDVHRTGPFALARLGRQDLFETPTPVTFDGVRADSHELGELHLSLSAYGGIPVHHFESSAGGDSVFGLAGELRPWHGARARLDWMSLRDEFLATDRHDELLGVRWWQAIDGSTLHGLHTWRDGKPRDLRLGWSGELPGDATLRVDYHELLTTQRAAVTGLDPYFEVAAEYHPYRQLDAEVAADLGEHVTWDVGGTVRRLADARDEGAFNREFERVYTGVDVHAFGVEGLSVGVTANWYDTDGEGFRAITGELLYRPDQTLRVALGSGYDLFRYDVFDDRDRVHVRSVYLRADRQVGARARVDAGYEYERDDEDEFHVFRLGVTWRW